MKQVKIFALFEQKKVAGQKFLLGDSEWLILDEKSEKKTGKKSIPFDLLENVKMRIVRVKFEISPPRYNSQGYDMSKFVKI